MWLDRLKDLRKEAGNPPYKHIASKADMPERTVTRIFSGETENPTIDNLLKIVNVLGGTPDEIFADTMAVIGRVSFSEHQAELDRLNGELSLAHAENAVLEERAAALTKENEILRLKLEHKEEIIALHNYYINLKN